MKIRFKKGGKGEIFREIFGRPKIQFFFRFEQIYLNSKREEKRREEKRRDGADRPTERERERESGAQVRAFEVKAEGLLNIPKNLKVSANCLNLKEPAHQGRTAAGLFHNFL